MRIENWPSKLAAAVAEAEQVPFKWGTNDCAAFAARCEIAITGETKFADLLGGYKTERGAVGRLRRAGFDCIEDIVAARLPEVHPNFAQRGDVVLVGAAIAIVIGDVAVLPGDDGLVRYPRESHRRAWRVV